MVGEAEVLLLLQLAHRNTIDQVGIGHLLVVVVRGVVRYQGTVVDDWWNRRNTVESFGT